MTSNRISRKGTNIPEDKMSEKDSRSELSPGEVTPSSKKRDTFNSDEPLSTTSDESKQSSPPTWKSYLLMIVLLIVYVAFNFLGAYLFQVIERKAEAGNRHWFNDYKKDFLLNHTNSLSEQDLEKFLEEVSRAIDEDVSSILGNDSVYEDKWTISNGFLLSFTIASTIGYGIVTPVTPGGQVFCIFYALLSIPFTGLLAAKIGSLMAYSIKRAASIIFEKKKHNQRTRIASIVFTFVAGLLIYILIPTIILLFVSNEEGWTFIECLYCVFVTLTTIGFGDYVPDPNSSGGMWINVFVLVWVVAGLAWFATIVNLIANLLTRQASTIRQKVANQHINMKTLKSATATLAGGRNKSRSKSSMDTIQPGENHNGVGGGGEVFQGDPETGQKYGDPESGDSQSGMMQDTPKMEDSPKTGEGSKSETAEAKKEDERDGEVTDDDTAKSSNQELQRVSRTGSLASRGSKVNEEILLGPSGFMAVVMNNMENYEHPDDISDDGT